MVIHLAGSPCPVGGSVTVLAPFMLECAGVVQLSVSTGCGCYPNVCSLISSILSVRPSCHVGEVNVCHSVLSVSLVMVGGAVM